MLVKLMLTKDNKVTIVDLNNKDLLEILSPLFSPRTNREIGAMLAEQAIIFVSTNIKERHIDPNTLFIYEIKNNIKSLEQARKVFKHVS